MSLWYPGIWNYENESGIWIQEHRRMRISCGSIPETNDVKYRTLFRIRIRHFRLNTNPDPNPGFWWPKIKNKLQLKKNIWYFFDQNCNLFMSKQQKPSVLNREHPASFKTWNFLTFFQFLWIIFALLDPDPLTWLNPDPIWIRNTS